MRRMFLLLVAVALMLAMSAPVALADNLFPCNDGTETVDDVAAGATGANYAKHHIKALATIGGLGNGGHKPGGHMGFSTCNPSGM